MKLHPSLLKLSLAMLTASGAVFALLMHAVVATEVITTTPSVATETQSNTLCPISGKPVDPSFTMVYVAHIFSLPISIFSDIRI